MSQLTHLDERGQAAMVDVSEKAVTARTAVAQAEVHMLPATLAAIREGAAPKGDVLAAARIAGIMAAKRTSELIPLCHPIALTRVEVSLTPREGDASILIESRVACVGKTGVEMEALTAVSVAALAVYDMVKALDRAVQIDDIHLVSKSGGKSGDYRAGTGESA